ncbi:MAG: hypothetical protein DVS81_07065 [Candidatus Accumulibacter meliphilus]|jgi:hypothetical protein|uniref:Uncharacterized protein n=1 Tax=Candidatus Accumulibacter meliphilus TaxID=2211374 RepID=A0A369XV44_9PROT|nr:MAG: hypothetical protein DVS81_07065 [Candidatus Accumulibacter meliphilus]
MLVAEGLGVDAGRKEQDGVQAAGKVLLQPLPEVLKVILGKVVLSGRHAVIAERVGEGLAGRIFQPGRSAPSSSQADNSSGLLSLSR